MAKIYNNSQLPKKPTKLWELPLFFYNNHIATTTTTLLPPSPLSSIASAT
jgi:hypothetical protein